MSPNFLVGQLCSWRFSVNYSTVIFSTCKTEKKPDFGQIRNLFSFSTEKNQQITLKWLTEKRQKYNWRTKKDRLWTMAKYRQKKKFFTCNWSPFFIVMFSFDEFFLEEFLLLLEELDVDELGDDELELDFEFGLFFSLSNSNSKELLFSWFSKLLLGELSSELFLFNLSNLGLT